MKRLFVVLAIISATLSVFSQSLPRMKDPYVTDAADILSRSELKQLRSDVKSMCDYYSTRIVVGIVSTFDDYDIDEYAGKLAEKWDLSDENTMLILVKPKSDEEQGEAMLLASSDLEDVFTNSVCDGIVREQMIPHFKNDDYFGGIEAALEYMNNMSDEEEPEIAVATTSSDDKEGSSSKFLEFLSDLGIGVVTIVKWILIFLAIASVVGLIVWLVIRKKEEKAKSSMSKPSHFSNSCNSEEISSTIADRRQEVEQRKRELEELRELDRESEELNNEYENLRNNSARGRRHDYDDYNTRDYYDDRRSSPDLNDLLGKLSDISTESKGGKILGTLRKVAVGAAGVAGAALIGKKVKEKRKNNKDDDDGLLGNINSAFRKKEKSSNASSSKPKLGDSGKTKASGGKTKLGGGRNKSKLGGNSSSGGW